MTTGGGTVPGPSLVRVQLPADPAEAGLAGLAGLAGEGAESAAETWGGEAGWLGRSSAWARAGRWRGPSESGLAADRGDAGDATDTGLAEATETESIDATDTESAEGSVANENELGALETEATDAEDGIDGTESEETTMVGLGAASARATADGADVEAALMSIGSDTDSGGRSDPADATWALRSRSIVPGTRSGPCAPARPAAPNPAPMATPPARATFQSRLRRGLVGAMRVLLVRWDVGYDDDGRR